MSPLLKSAAMFMAPSTMNTAARERTGSAVRASGKPGARPCMPHASALQPLPGTPSRHASYSLACARHDQPREDERDDAGPPGALDEPPHDHDAHEAGADAHAAKRQGVVDGDAAEEEEKRTTRAEVAAVICADPNMCARRWSEGERVSDVEPRDTVLPRHGCQHTYRCRCRA